jgi:hypothetical protein
MAGADEDRVVGDAQHLLLVGQREVGPTALDAAQLEQVEVGAVGAAHGQLVHGVANRARPRLDAICVLLGGQDLDQTRVVAVAGQRLFGSLDLCGGGRQRGLGLAHQLGPAARHGEQQVLGQRVDRRCGDVGLLRACPELRRLATTAVQAVRTVAMDRHQRAAARAAQHPVQQSRPLRDYALDRLVLGQPPGDRIDQRLMRVGVAELPEGRHPEVDRVGEQALHRAAAPNATSARAANAAVPEERAHLLERRTRSATLERLADDRRVSRVWAQATIGTSQVADGGDRRAVHAAGDSVGSGLLPV